jgi:hypothetical protein
VILLLMLLISAMSSKAHFATMILPGFCLARLAVRTKNVGFWMLLLLSILAGFSFKQVFVGR